MRHSDPCAAGELPGSGGRSGAGVEHLNVRKARGGTTRRLLACVVAAEFVVAAAALTTVTDDRRGEFEAAGGSVALASDASASSEDSCPNERSSEGRATAGSPGSAPSGSSADNSGEGGERISFKPPIDFATGAVPSAEAFNAASGDQLGLGLVHATLSDSVAVGDFDKDGNDDVAQTNVIAGSVSVFLGDGRSGFAAPNIHPVGVHPHHIVTGDLDADGDLDLAVANSGSNNVAILTGDGRGGFRPGSQAAVPTPRDIAIGKFNDDDIPDLAVASHSPSGGCASDCGAASIGGVAILMATRASNGTVTFAVTQFIRPVREGDDRPTSANFVTAADFDGNGRDDLAVGVGTKRTSGVEEPDGTVSGDDVFTFLNRKASSGDPFNTTPHQVLRVGATPDAGVVADLNDDGHSDLAVMNNGTGSITSMLGDGEGHFVVKAENVSVGAVPRSLVVGDFNDDGIDDLATASFGQSTVSVLKGEGDGRFEPAIDFWAGDAPTSVGVGHFDEDGRVDIVAGRLRTDKLSLLVNDSPQRGDGVEIKRDIAYGAPPGPYARHQMLDVYLPPNGTQSFAGQGKPYPIVMYVHGGAAITGDKTMVSYLMRSLAMEGLVAVSTNYRLGPELQKGQAEDVAQAIRWVRDNLGSSEYGGDPNNFFPFGQSAGVPPLMTIVSDPAFKDARDSIRGLILEGGIMNADKAMVVPPTVLISGDQGLELAVGPTGAAFAAAAQVQGRTDIEHFLVHDRDHFTITSRLALPGDEGRAHVLEFVRANLSAR